MAHRNPLGMAALVVLACGGLPGSAQADPSWADRLRDEALPCWDHELASSKPIQGTVDLLIKRSTQVTDYRFETKSNSECNLYIHTDRTRGTVEVIGYNPKYTFKLRSLGGREWALASVHLADQTSDESAKQLRKMADDSAKLGQCGFRFTHNLESLAAYVRRPGSRVASVELVNHKGIELIELKLDIAQSSGKDEFKALTSRLDPARKWRAVRIDAAGQFGEYALNITTDYEYLSDQDCVPKRVTDYELWKRSDGSTTAITRDRTFDMRRLATLPDTREFTLSAFGLPEPAGVSWPARRSPWQ